MRVVIEGAEKIANLTVHIDGTETRDRKVRDVVALLNALTAPKARVSTVVRTEPRALP